LKPWDVAVIGAGILGTSVTYWLSSLYDGRIVDLERESQVAQHASRRNTGIVHRPFYLDPVKRRLFAKSAQTAYGMWKTYARERRLPWNPVGTFEIATHEDQVARLEAYYRWGQQNGMDPNELQLLTPDQVRHYEPHVRCHGAIWSKTDTSVNYRLFTESLRVDAENEGAKFLMNSHVSDVTFRGDVLDVHLVGRSEPVKTRFLINCAGGDSIRVAHMLNVGEDYTDLNFRGEYWRVNKDVAYLANRNIYTIPRHPEFPFLDPHWVIRTDGQHEIGPNAVPVAGPYTYEGFFNNPVELVSKLMEHPVRNKLSLLFNADFLTLAGQEWLSSISKSAMAHRVQEFLPELNVKDLTTPGTAGIRAAIIDYKGNFIKEAIELAGPLSHHIANYNSPGATGSPAYSAYVVNKLESKGHLDGLKPKPNRSKSLWDFETVCEAIDAPSTPHLAQCA
jgi:L-2-hydroxyglutarate oxidase